MSGISGDVEAGPVVGMCEGRIAKGFKPDLDVDGVFRQKPPDPHHHVVFRHRLQPARGLVQAARNRTGPAQQQRVVVGDENRRGQLLDLPQGCDHVADAGGEERHRKTDIFRRDQRSAKAALASSQER